MRNNKILKSVWNPNNWLGPGRKSMKHIVVFLDWTEFVLTFHWIFRLVLINNVNFILFIFHVVFISCWEKFPIEKENGGATTCESITVALGFYIFLSRHFVFSILYFVHCMVTSTKKVPSHLENPISFSLQSFYNSLSAAPSLLFSDSKMNLKTLCSCSGVLTDLNHPLCPNIL